MNVKITPSVPTGEITLPSSKSVAHRALIAASCADKPCVLTGKFLGDDIFATADCLEKLGAEIEKSETALRVTPILNRPSHASLYVGASGSTLRFLLPLSASLGVETDFSGTERLSSRPIGALLDELERHGVKASGSCLPLTLNGNLTGGKFEIDASVSSQFLTGLMLALPNVNGGRVVPSGKIVSKNYLDITAAVMRVFGVSVTEDENGVIYIDGKYTSPKKYAVESDWSSAAFFAVAGAIGKEVTLVGLDPESTQGDKALLSCLERAGASVMQVGKNFNVKKKELRPFEFDLENCPDAAPALAVLAAFCDGVSVLTGTGRLKIKESDRAEEIVKMLSAFGAEAKDYGDRITVVGTGRLSGGNLVLPDDHRIAMAAAIAASGADGETVLSGAECVAKSYPTFFEDFNKLGGKANVLAF